MLFLRIERAEILEAKTRATKWSGQLSRVDSESIFSLELAALERGYDLSNAGKRYLNKLTFRGRLSKLKVLISCLVCPSNIFDGYLYFWRKSEWTLRELHP